jgi:cell division protease FtsH
MDKPTKDEGNRGVDRAGGTRRPQNWWIILTVVALLAIMLFYNNRSGRVSEIKYSFFLQELKNKNVQSVTVGPVTATGFFKLEPIAPAEVNTKGDEVTPKAVNGAPAKLNREFYVNLPPGDSFRVELNKRLEESGAIIGAQSTDATQSLMMFLMFALPLIVIFTIWMLYRRTRDQIVGGGFLSSFSRSTAKRYEPSDQQTTFKDVAGLEGVKADLQEIVDYLKSPEKFQKLGGRVPKGVLLNGSPGTGKTLLARAIAGEAGVPFYSVSGSEFIQMFVGVGASRVRDLFQTAKENSPAIIFIDEIDAVGRQRGAGLGGGHDEREQTLNQILSEMDGFSPSDSVIVVAATNRPDVLDPALLRPGRFDRHITVSRPTLKGRFEIFKVHVREVPLDQDVDLQKLAAATVGLTGADIRNIVNEAALWAARNDKTRVAMEDFEYARDKALIGAKREEVLQHDEKEKTAYHEAGHTIAAWFLPGARRVHKVTIIPRGRSLGSTQILPSEDRVSMSQTELQDELVVLLGGRAAEKLIYNETTVGAENDLERATSLARRMVTHWGMSAKLGPVSYKTGDDDPFLGREIHQQRQFSEHTQELIDAEVASILHAADERAFQILLERKELLEGLKDGLLKKEELDESEIEGVLGPSVHPPRPSMDALI